MANGSIPEKEMEAAIDAALSEVRRQVIKATIKHGPMHSAHEGYAVILEELDELKECVWAQQHDNLDMQREAAHVAAMGVRFIVDVCKVRGEKSVSDVANHQSYNHHNDYDTEDEKFKQKYGI